MIRRGFLLLLLAGCATPSLDTGLSENSLQIVGRVSISHDGRRDTGGFDYQLAGNLQTWQLFGPTGTRLGTLAQTREGAIWSPADGPTQTADDLDRLVQDALGVPAPLSSAQYFMRGLTPPETDQRTDDGFIIDGWTLSWLRFNEQGQPRLIQLENESTQIRLVAKSWN